MGDIRDAFPSKYLKANDLQGRGVNVTIDRVDFEAVGQDRQMKPVVYFSGKEKGMVLNKTNCNKIIQITSSPVTEDWGGVRIQIYPTETSFQGEQVDCIRVRAVSNGQRQSAAPSSPPPPPPMPEIDIHGEDDDTPF